MPDRKKKDSTISRLELAAGAVLLVLWALCSVDSFRAEATAVKVIPEAMRLKYEEKKSLMDGPVYRVTKKVSSATRPRSSVCLYTPTAGAESSYYFLKARYYLYPRKVIDGGSGTLRTDDLKRCDYLAVYISKGQDYGRYGDLDILPYLARVYGDPVDGGYEALYEVKEREAR